MNSKGTVRQKPRSDPCLKGGNIAAVLRNVTLSEDGSRNVGRGRDRSSGYSRRDLHTSSLQNVNGNLFACSENSWRQ
jgi:hypothetical protein